MRIITLLSRQGIFAPRENPLRKIQILMPDLLREMSIDLKGNPVIREFFVTDKRTIFNYGDQCFVYYIEDHDNLPSKVKILENYGFVIDITTRKVKEYRITEKLAEFLLSIGEQIDSPEPLSDD